MYFRKIWEPLYVCLEQDLLLPSEDLFFSPHYIFCTPGQLTVVNQLTFCRSWEPEYFAEMDFISPPNAEAQSFTLQVHTHARMVKKKK